MKSAKDLKRPRFEKGGYPQPVLPEHLIKEWRPPKSGKDQKDTNSG